MSENDEDEGERSMSEKIREQVREGLREEKTTVVDARPDRGKSRLGAHKGQVRARKTRARDRRKTASKTRARNRR